eukprot:scaffold101798_cov40-Tisochrysis_lutea.AAC.2
MRIRAARDYESWMMCDQLLECGLVSPRESGESTLIRQEHRSGNDHSPNWLPAPALELPRVIRQVCAHQKRHAKIRSVLTQ